MATDANRQRSDESALDAIAAAMSGTEWSPDTLDTIASIVRETGRAIRDPEDADEPGAQE